jgi:hypothetical protein
MTDVSQATTLRSVIGPKELEDGIETCGPASTGASLPSVQQAAPDMPLTFSGSSAMWWGSVRARVLTLYMRWYCRRL